MVSMLPCGYLIGAQRPNQTKPSSVPSAGEHSPHCNRPDLGHHPDTTTP